MRKLPRIKRATEGRPWKTVPDLARRYSNAHDLGHIQGMDYFDDDIINRLQEGDAPVSLVRTTDDAKKLPEPEDLGQSLAPPDNFLLALLSHQWAFYNQLLHDRGIVYERHNKGVPVLQICRLKLQCDPEDNVKWKWDQVTKEDCTLEIDRSNKDEQEKKIVKFCFATNDTDKLLSLAVDGYEVEYMLRTDAIRLELELEIELDPALGIDDDSVWGDIKLRIMRHVKPCTIDLLDDQRPAKKPKNNHNSEPYKISIIRNVPHDLCPYMRLLVTLKDESGVLDVKHRYTMFPYSMPVDQEGCFHFEGGRIKYKAFWGCCSPDGEGIVSGFCTGVCTCEPAEFIGFCSPGDACCKDGSELLGPELPPKVLTRNPGSLSVSGFSFGM